MKSYKKRLLELMEEIDSICQKNGLKYILSDKTAARAKKNGCFLTDPYTFNIMMDINDLIRFCEIVKDSGRKDRVIESFKNSASIENFYFRYADPTTTVINFKRGLLFKYPCVAINIKPLRHVMPEGFYAKLERVITSPGSKKRVFIKKLAKGLVYNHIVKENKAPAGDTLCYYTNNRKWLKFPTETIKNTEKIPFHGLSLNVVTDIETYERKYYGKEWQEIIDIPYQTVNVLQVISETDFSHSEFDELLRKKGLPSADKLVKSWKKNDRWYSSARKGLAGEVERDYSYAKRTVRRFDMYQYYLPLLDTMKGYVKDKNFDELSKALAPYLNETYRYYKMNMGYYVCDDLWKLAMIHWTIREKLGYAEKVKALIPKELLDTDLPALYAKYNQ